MGIYLVTIPATLFVEVEAEDPRTAMGKAERQFGRGHLFEESLGRLTRGTKEFDGFAKPSLSCARPGAFKVKRVG